jgi:hypothetical protein
LIGQKSSSIQYLRIIFFKISVALSKSLEAHVVISLTQKKYSSAALHQRRETISSKNLALE